MSARPIKASTLTTCDACGKSRAVKWLLAFGRYQCKFCGVHSWRRSQ